MLASTVRRDVYSHKVPVSYRGAEALAQPVDSMQARREERAKSSTALLQSSIEGINCADLNQEDRL